MILDEIVKAKSKQLEEEKKHISIEAWKEKLKHTGLSKTIDFHSTLKGKDKISIIAEIKKASPSKGIIKADFEPVRIAVEYYMAGVDAISVLTESNYFKGQDEHLVKVRQSVPLPVLRKDFIIDVWQIYQSRYIGADAILLIASILTDGELKKFLAVAGILGMQCLVEVHDEKEVERALAAGAKIIGINNRDLRTFDTDLKTTERLKGLIPEDRVVVSESGIRTSGDMKYLKSLGVDAVLIGETFVKAASIGEKVQEIRAGSE